MLLTATPVETLNTYRECTGGKVAFNSVVGGLVVPSEDSLVDTVFVNALVIVFDSSFFSVGFYPVSTDGWVKSNPGPLAASSLRRHLEL